MSDTGSNNPYDPPSDGGSGSTPPPPPPQWGSNPPSAAEQPGQPGQPGGSGAWTGGQLSSGQYGQQPGQPGGEQYGQPGGQPYGQPYGQPAGGPPPNYLVWSILSTLLCCLPLGVVSIVYAAQVNSKYAGGDVAGARQSSEKAKKFAIWSAVAGLVVAVLYIVGIVAVAMNSDTSP